MGMPVIVIVVLIIGRWRRRARGCRHLDVGESRFVVMQHLGVLRAADLVHTVPDGRRRINHLNPVPLQRIYERWVSKYEGAWAAALTGLAATIEGTEGTTTTTKTPAGKTPAKARLVIRHLDRVGVLANVLGLVREAGINVEEVQNTVFEEAQAASCAIDLDETPPPELLERIRALKDEVLFVDKVEL